MVTQKRLIDKIDSPADLKKIGRDRLPGVADEVRRLILDVVSKTGGHLASSLGAVELAIAIHYVFNAPDDKIVWDVGHQCYPHKILTGRRDSFRTLRQDGGISGFPRPVESEYDAFGTGHSGTSIAAALGFARAEHLLKRGRKSIAVIGDASVATGMALTAMNTAGAIGANMVVVLNDNEMSISPNVGALSAHMSQIITGEMYNRLKQDYYNFLSMIPGIGQQIEKAAHRFEEAVKGMIVPGRLFEDLGFKYVGPIDGHNIDYLLDTFESVKKLDGPILVHVVTKKGKGYALAEEKPAAYHGVGPFDIKSGKQSSSGSTAPSYTDIFSRTMVELGSTDTSIVAITAAMTDGTGLRLFADKFTDRFYDMGIAEETAVTFAAGLASQGLRPVVAIYSTFLQRAVDQIIHDVCLMNLPVTFAIDRGGFVGQDGATHHGMFDLTYLRMIPNIIVMAPKDENELRRMLKTALQHNGPAAVRYPRGTGEDVPLDKEIHPLEIGKGELVRTGEDISLIAIGTGVPAAMEAADILADNGVSAEVINARFVKPLDADLILTSLAKTGCGVSIEENVAAGGFGSAILELIAARMTAAGSDVSPANHQNQAGHGIDLDIAAVADRFIEHASQSQLRKQMELDPEGIARRAMALLAKRGLRQHAAEKSASRHSSRG